MTLYVIRHPATVWTGVRYLGRHDVAWSAAGQRRATDLVERIPALLGSSSVVISSPLRRASLLAQRIAASAAVELETDDRWMEVDVGLAQGRTFADLEASRPLVAGKLASGDVEVNWPGGERGSDLRERVIAAFEDAARRSAGPVVVVTHAGPIAMLLAHIAPSQAIRFIGAGDALAFCRADSGGWTVSPAGIPSR